MLVAACSVRRNLGDTDWVGKEREKLQFSGGGDRSAPGAGMR